MGRSKVYSFSFLSFLKGTFLWALSIPIGYLPLVMAQLLISEQVGAYSFDGIVHAVVSDLDYLFSYLCILYALYLQGEYAESSFQGVVFCKRICALIAIPLLIAWVILFLLPNLRAEYENSSFIFNKWMSIGTLVLGVLMQLVMAFIEKEGKEQK